MDCYDSVVGAVEGYEDRMEPMSEDEGADVRERERFRSAFAADAVLEQEIKDALEGGALDRIRKRVLARYSFVQAVWQAQAEAEGVLQHPDGEIGADDHAAEQAANAPLDPKSEHCQRHGVITRLRDFANHAQMYAWIAAALIVFVLTTLPFCAAY
jgi:hypothetical protein